MRYALIAGVACGLVVLAGCTDSGSTTAPTLSDARVSAILKGAGENSKFLYDAEQQLVSLCMRRAGFTFHADTQQQDSLPDPFSGTRLTLEEAQRDGYGLRQSTSSANASTRDPNAEVIAGLSASESKRYQEALYGPDDTQISVKIGELTVGAPGKGCFAEARKTIYGDLEKWTRLNYVANNVLAEASQTVGSDDTLIDAAKRWSDCMAESGFHYDSRRAARNDLAKRYQAMGADIDAVFHAEVATATVDAKCAQRTGFESVQQQAQAHASAVAVTKHEGDLLAAQEMNATAVARARKALAGS